jgi:Holliday junction DNA helicase RuvA
MRRSQSGRISFELLLSVSGIGPKSALGILDIASSETLRSAIASGNAAYLTSVSGIGKKTAEKIVLELKDKIIASGSAGPAMPKGDMEALEAMRALGYSADEGRTALREVPPEVEGTSERLREALRLLGSQRQH